MGRISVTASAPGRVNLIGEHTDYNHGLCLPMALTLSTTVRATSRSDGILSITSEGFGEPWSEPLADLSPRATRGWHSYAAGVIWALGETVGGPDRLWPDGLDLRITSTVPSGAGLSSSAAVECATAIAAVSLMARRWTRQQLVSACIRAETEMAGAPTGGMDQTIAMFAPVAGALLLDFRLDTAVRRRPVSLPLAESGLSLLIIDTGVVHDLGDGAYAARRDACERACAALGVSSLREANLAEVERLSDDLLRRRARHVVTENRRVADTVDALAAGDWPSVGAHFAASHASMRDDFEISTPELDAVVETAMASGAVAARMTGGGFGGSAVVVVGSDQRAAVTRAVDQRFADHGWRRPAYLEARPGRAARWESRER